MQYSARDKTETLADILDRLPQANMIFTVTNHLAYGESSIARLIISPVLTASQLTSLVDGTGNRFDFTVKVSDKMQAHLSGESFAIENASSDIQAVSVSEPTIWLWHIRPLRLGEQWITLDVDAIVNVKNENINHVVRSFSTNIVVDVRWPSSAFFFWQEYWQLILAGSVTFACGIFALLKFYESKREHDPKA